MTMQQQIHDCDAILFDFDSTLVTIEGIDELARMKGVFDEVESLTRSAMEGEIAFSQVFEARLDRIRPTRYELENLGQLYKENITKDAKACIDYFVTKKKDIYVMSGGYSEALYPVTDYLGIQRNHVFANSLRFDTQGNYVTFDRDIPLWNENGKQRVFERIQKKHAMSWIAIGDGMTDAQLTPYVDAFICFTGVVSREKVLQQATYVCSDFKSMYHC